jgi:hypothetical protein
VFLRLVTKMSDWFLEYRIYIKFCVKLEKKMQETLVHCCTRLVGMVKVKLSLYFT